VPVTRNFLQRLVRQRRYPLSDLAGQCWALTLGTIPSNEYVYYMWDTLTTGYLGAAQFITFRQAQTKAIAAGPSAGRIKEIENGRLIRAADRVDVEGFLDYVLKLLGR
jgi:purine nucleosidase